MPQIKQTCSVTNGSQNVTIAGVNLSSRVRKNNIFMVEGALVPYVVASDSVFDGTNTIVTLTGAYQDATDPAAKGVFAVDLTYPDNIPTIAQGDVGTAAIFTQAMYKLQDMISAVNPNGFQMYSDMYNDVVTMKDSVDASERHVSTLESSASASATAAATSATNVKTSETNAAASQAAAATSAANAKTSETNAKTSETNASASMTTAQKWATQTSAEVVAGQGYGAKKYATDAAGSATAAATSATNAKTSETNAKTSETNAATSASTATTQATTATTQAGNASTSATNAANSANAASNSATAASTSAGNAKTSENNAAGSASAVATSATNAKTSETNAKASETNAAASASAAASSKTAAGTSEANAAGSASAASTSATNAANSATAAATSASNAKTSETNAKTSETNAAGSASSAASSASSLQAALAAFNSTFIGRLASDPTKDGNGNPLTDGAEYFNTTTEKLRVYSAGAWSNYDASAQTYTTNASLSATNAASSASAASTSASNAATSASNAKTSETNAATSASNAATSASNAKTSETNAKTSETNAGTSATNSATSATNSSNSATLAQNWATQASGEVVTGKGYSAYYYAQQAAASAATALSGQISSDWGQTNTSAKDFIKNKPNLPIVYPIPYNSNTAGWVKLGTFTVPSQTGHMLKLEITSHTGYNSSAAQSQETVIVFKTTNGSSFDGNGFAGDGYFYTIGLNGGQLSAPIAVKIKADAAGAGARNYDVWINQGVFEDNTFYAASVSPAATWANNASLTFGQADPGAASSTIVALSNIVPSFGGKQLALAGANTDITSLTGLTSVTYGSASRILGEFSNGVLASRTMFQSTSTNGFTSVGLMPNGSGTTSQINAHNTSDPGNSSYLAVGANGGTTFINSKFIGTGTQLPIQFMLNGTITAQVDSTGLSVTGTTGSTNGFTTPAYVLNARNPIWRFGNADQYGISYFQDTAGYNQHDTIGFHFGNATAAGNAFWVNDQGWVGGGWFRGYGSDSGIVFSSFNTTAQGSPEQFRVYHNLSDTYLTNQRGALYLKGQADTAAKLAIARNIQGVAFDGSGNISLPVPLSGADGASYQIAAGTDLNALVGTTGFYRGQQLLNAPNGNTGWFYITQEVHDSGWTKQIATSYGSGNKAGETYQRMKYNGSTWGIWIQITDGSYDMRYVIKRRASRYNTADGTSINNIANPETGFDYDTAGAGVTGPFIHFGGLSSYGDYGCQIVAAYKNGNDIRFRTKDNDTSGVWNPWRYFWHSGNLMQSVVATANTVVQRDANGYIQGNYINMSDDSNPNGAGGVGTGGPVTAIITKQGDNYYRGVSAQKVKDFLGLSTINASGIGATTNLNTVLSPGFYYMASLPINAPGGTSDGQLLVLGHPNKDTTAQIASDYSTGRLFVRTGRYWGNAWSVWRTLAWTDSEVYRDATLVNANIRNSDNGPSTFFSTLASATRIVTFPDKSGTVAMTSDIPAVATPALVLLAQMQPLNVTYMDFLNVCSDAYDKYIIEITRVLPAQAASLILRMANGGTVDTSGVYSSTLSSGSTTITTNLTSMSLAGAVASPAETSNACVNLTIEVTNARNAGGMRTVHLHGGFYNSSGAFQSVATNGVYNGSTISGFRLYWSVGNTYPSGVVRVYGVVNN